MARSDFYLHGKLVVTLTLVVPAVATCQAAPRGLLARDQFQRVVDSAVKAGMPGVQAYVRHSHREWYGVSGLASVEANRPMTRADRIRLASITKMMTYAATMELVKQRRFALADRAITLLPPGVLEGVPFADEITVAQLLDHTSGLHNFNGSDGQDFFEALFGDGRRRRQWTPEELIAFARNPSHAPTGRPGERGSYSSTGYLVLQRILEHQTKRPFHEVVRELVFRPLDMHSAGVEGGDLDGSAIADSYAVPGPSDIPRASPFDGRRPIRRDGLVNVSAGLPVYGAWAGAAGAAAATVDDLAKFMNAVVANRLIVLKDQAQEFAAAARRPNASFSWNGGSWGIQASILYEPGRDIVVVVLCNASNVGTSSQEIARTLLAVARGGGS